MVLRIGGEQNKQMEKLVSMIMLSCYKNIRATVAQKMATQSAEEIDPLTEENKELLQIELWRHLYEKNDNEGINRELNSLAEIMKELQAEEETEEFKENLNDFVAPTPPRKDISILGINFSEISHGVKNMIGLAFLAIVVVLILYGLKSLRKPEKKDKKKKKSS
jgi:hypothetical protein